MFSTDENFATYLKGQIKYLFPYPGVVCVL